MDAGIDPFNGKDCLANGGNSCSLSAGRLRCADPSDDLQSINSDQ